MQHDKNAAYGDSLTAIRATRADVRNPNASKKLKLIADRS
jgi:hypothetical protein